MTLGVSHPGPGARLGADQCPGTAQRGHGLTMAVLHDTGCCTEWETGRAATPQGGVIPPGRRPVGHGLAGRAPAAPAQPGLRTRQGTPERPRRLGRPPAGPARSRTRTRSRAQLTAGPSRGRLQVPAPAVPGPYGRTEKENRP